MLNRLKIYPKSELLKQRVSYSHYTTPDTWIESEIIKVQYLSCDVPAGKIMRLTMKNGDVIQFDLYNIKILEKQGCSDGPTV